MKESVIPLKGKTDCRAPYGARNDEEGEKWIATRLAEVSPAGSVGASALQRCPPNTRTFAMTGKRKYIRTPYGVCNDKEVKKDYRTPKGVQ